MNEILKRIEKLIDFYQEELDKLDDLVNFFPELLSEVSIKKDAISDIIDSLEEIVEDFE